MKLLTVPASRGVLWVRSGFRVFFGKPLAFAALFASMPVAARLASRFGFARVLVVTGRPCSALQRRCAWRASVRHCSLAHHERAEQKQPLYLVREFSVGVLRTLFA